MTDRSLVMSGYFIYLLFLWINIFLYEELLKMKILLVKECGEYERYLLL